MYVAHFAVAILYALSAFFVAGGLHKIWKFESGLKWKQTEASVLKTISIVRHGGRTMTYSPLVEYKYSVSNEEYTATGEAKPESSESIANKIVISNYSPGQCINAWYNTETPSESCLRAQTLGDSILQVVLGLVVLSFAIIIQVSLS